MVRIHSGVPHKPQKTQEIRDKARSAEAEICIHLYPIQKKSETGGILDAEEILGRARTATSRLGPRWTERDYADLARLGYVTRARTRRS